MKIGDVIHILSEFNKWRRGEPPYEWSEDPSKQNELPYSAGEIGVAIDEAVAMLRKSADMEREERRERKYEYAVRWNNYAISFRSRPEKYVREAVSDINNSVGRKICHAVRRSVGEWEVVK